MQLFVQFAISKDVKNVDLQFDSSGQPPTTADLKARIRDDTGFRLDMMQLSHNGCLLHDSERLCDQNVDEGALIYLRIKAPQFVPHPSQKTYEEFFSHVRFIDSNGHVIMQPTAVPTSPSIILQLKADKWHHRLDLKSLIDIVAEDDTSMSMQQTFGFDEAKKRGFMQWTSSHLKYERVMLLEMTNFAGVHTTKVRQILDSRRYSYDGINQLYKGGDRHSWQRYTRQMPIPCTFKVDEEKNQIRFYPRETLKFGQEYIILLMHGGKIMPYEKQDGDSSLFTLRSRRQCDVSTEPEETGQWSAENLTVLSDHLIFFTTVHTPDCAPPEGRVESNTKILNRNGLHDKTHVNPPSAYFQQVSVIIFW